MANNEQRQNWPPAHVHPTRNEPTNAVLIAPNDRDILNIEESLEILGSHFDLRTLNEAQSSALYRLISRSRSLVARIRYHG